MWSDNETTVDYLNFGVVADACAKLVQRAQGTPLSIGISGGWGVGKTSLVRMIEHRLKDAQAPGENTYVVVTFNPWVYQDFEGARSALLQLVGDEVLRLAASDEKLLKKAKRLLKRINLLRLAQLGGEAAVTLYTGVPVGSIGTAIMKVGGFLGIGERTMLASRTTTAEKRNTNTKVTMRACSNPPSQCLCPARFRRFAMPSNSCLPS